MEAVFDISPSRPSVRSEVAPSDPNVIYVGTGESEIRSNLASGDGIYKSMMVAIHGKMLGSKTLARLAG